MYKLQSRSLKNVSNREKKVASYYLYEQQIEELKEISDGEPSEKLREILSEYLGDGDER